MARSARLAFRSALCLATALAAGSTAVRAADVSVTLDAGAGFSVKNSTGAFERLRVDEATGNISRNGALFVHTTGSNNTFVGVGAGNPSTSGFRNTAFGAAALAANTNGFNNSAVGHNALNANTSGIANSAFGYGALATNTTGLFNSAVGATALRANTTGDYNTAVGVSALWRNTTGGRNAAFGYSALRDNVSGSSSVAFGHQALAYSTSSRNSAVGARALRSDTTGLQNSAFGYEALLSNTTGRYNSAVGDSALRSNTTGYRNVAVGRNAGRNQTTGSDNIYLVNQGVAGESGRIRIGTGAHTATFIAGIRGVTTANANAIPVLIDSAGQLGTVSSSRSVKRDIRDMGDATSRLLELRPVTFRYKQEQTPPGGREVPPEYGLIAEEVAAILPDLVVYDEKGAPFTVKYHELAPMLLNEMKKQQRSIEEQREKYEGRIGALEVRLAQLESRAAP